MGLSSLRLTNWKKRKKEIKKGENEWTNKENKDKPEKE